VTGRLASFAFGRSRQSVPAQSKPSKPSKQPPPPLPPIPEALRTVLESIVEMLKGHDELSGRLKEQWAKAFPLVRGLAAIWSDQVSLESTNCCNEAKLIPDCTFYSLGSFRPTQLTSFRLKKLSLSSDLTCLLSLHQLILTIPSSQE